MWFPAHRIAAVAVVVALLPAPPPALSALTGVRNRPVAPTALRVCASTDDLPYSNQGGEGFENRIALEMASELGRRLELTWTDRPAPEHLAELAAGRCDVVLGVPVGTPAVLTTSPYYTSSLVLVSRLDRRVPVRGLADPALRRLRVAAESDAPPPLAPPVPDARSYPRPGAYREDRGAALDAVIDRHVDVALVRASVAHFFAPRRAVPLRITPLPPGDAARAPAAEIGMAVRRADVALRDALDRALARRDAKVRDILREFGLAPPPAARLAEGG